MSKKKLVFFVCMMLMTSFIVIFPIENVKAAGSILYVGGSGGGNYTSIQEAIDNANDGDTVFVYDDSSPYYENIVIDISINLIGENRDTTVINGGGSGDIVHISRDWVNISGFNVQNGDIGISVNSDFNIIKDNKISLINHDGINLYTSSNNIISGNELNNTADAIELWDFSNNNIFSSNKICNNYEGISLHSSNNNIISDCIILNNDFGIKFENSNNNQIRYCQIFNNMWGINIASNISSSGNNNTIINCDISNNFALGVHLFFCLNTNIWGNTFINDGIGIAGSSLEHFIHNINSNNTVNGKPLYYFVNEENMIIDSWDIGQLILVNCTGFSITNIEFSGTEIGLEAAFCSNNSIIDCNVHNNWYGIYLVNSSYNIVENCNLSNHIGKTSRNGPWWSNGISIFGSHNIIKNNNISKNEVGIIILTVSDLPSFISEGNIIEGNDIYFNNYTGVILLDSADNYIYHNNFVKNSHHAFDNGTNTWDDGKKGNYWDDFEEKYPNASKICCKGIWDTPYEIPGGNNKDMYPLINQWPISKPRIIPRNNPFNTYLLNWLLERFPLLEKLLWLIRAV